MKLADAERHGDLYPDRHLNVFVPFQSHDLDYNVTRALVATLRWSRSEVTRAFLEEVAGLSAGEGACHYDMGACDYEDFDPADVAQRLVLGVSLAGALAPDLPSLDDVDQAALQAIFQAPVPLPAKLEQVRRTLARPELDLDQVATLAHTLDELAEGSLPDGWIFSQDGGYCVLIEAKLLRYLDRYQLERYAEVWYGAHASPEQLVLRTWRDVAGFFAGYRDDADARTAFLCSQLCDYLDLLGLAAFHGFKPYDFDGDTLQESLPKFLGFAQAVRDAAAERGLPLGPAQATPTGARIPFTDAALPGHLALDLLEEGIRIEHRVGDSPEGRLAGRAGVDRILEVHEERPPEASPLTVPGPAGYHVRVERHRAPAPGAPGHLERETYRDALGDAAFDVVLSELRRQHPAQETRDSTGQVRRGVLAVGRTVDRHTAVGDGDGKPVLELAAATVADLARLARQLLPETTSVTG